MPSVRKKRSRKNARISTTQYGRKLKRRNRKKCRIEMDCIREKWDSKKSLKKNLSELGLSFDPNKTIPIKQEEHLMAMEEEKGVGFCEDKNMAPLQNSNSDLISELESIAAQSQPKKAYIMSPSEAKFIAHLVSHYGTNYKKMVKDKKNFNQLTEGQLRKKCAVFHKSPYVYLLDSDPL